jgi:outer membrane protein with beta-barrel domain
MPADFRTILVAGAITILSVGVAATADAQSSIRPYVGASIGSFSLDSDDVDGRTAAAGFVVGLTWRRHVDVELDAVFPTASFSRTFTGVMVSFAPQGSSPQEIERLGVVSHSEWDRRITSNISAVILIHPPVTGRVVPALVAGVTNQRTRTTTRTTPLVIPAGVDPQHPAVVAREERYTRNMGGPTIGAQLAVYVTPRFSVVPDVRYVYGSIGDEINNTLRLSVRTVWRF